jgi:hypothetical protein
MLFVHRPTVNFFWRRLLLASAFSGLCCVSSLGQSKADSFALPDGGRLKSVVQGVVKAGAIKNGGLSDQEAAAVVNRDGIVCNIVFTGTTRAD